MDFTLNKYRQLCTCALENGYQIQTVASYLRLNDNNHKMLIMRHDVDRIPKRALEMAILEHSLGIQSTYYFRKANFGEQSLIKAVSSGGHEVGYHYETLDEAKGDDDTALALFAKHLSDLRTIVPVTTICMHGAPFTRWLNSDLWKQHDFRQLDLNGEAFLSIRDVYYLSDTGRKWDMSRKIKDNLPGGLPLWAVDQGPVTKTDDLLRLVREGVSPLYITIHPERWSSNFIDWLHDSIKDSLINFSKSAFRKLKSGSG